MLASKSKLIKISIIIIGCIIAVSILSYLINTTNKIIEHDINNLIITNGTCIITKRVKCKNDSNKINKRSMGDKVPPPPCESYVNCTVTIYNSTINYIGIIYSSYEEIFHKKGESYKAYFLYDPKSMEITDNSWNYDIQLAHNDKLYDILYSLIVLIILFCFLSFASIIFFIIYLRDYIKDDDDYTILPS